MPKIAKILTHRFRLPMQGSLTWGSTGHMHAVEHVLVRVVTDTGHVGLAEAPPRPTIYGETPQSIITIIQEYLAPRLMGVDIADRATITNHLEAIAHNNAAKAALDIAIHEARAASQGQTLLEYIAPAQHHIKVSYILSIADTDAALAEARRVYEQGVRVLKVKVGRDFKADLHRIAALQHEFTNSGLSLYADANETMPLDEVYPRLKQLTRHNILYVEEPIPVEYIPERATLRKDNILPLIADDSTFTRRDLYRELDFDTFHILNIKPPRTGYTQSRQMLEMAYRHNKGVMIGSQASSTLGTIRAAYFAGLWGVTHPCELSFCLKLTADIVTQPIRFADGSLDLKQLAGIALDEDRLKQHIVTQA